MHVGLPLQSLARPCSLQNEELAASTCDLKNFIWYHPWGACNAVCGGGQRTRSVDCILKAANRPSTFFGDCQDFNGNDIPLSTLPPTTGACNVQPCASTLAMWSVGPWSACSEGPTINSYRATKEYYDGGCLVPPLRISG